MQRYHFLTDKDVFESLDKVRDAFLAAKNGQEVDEIINSILTRDEKIRIGRRIMLEEVIDNFTVEDLIQIAHVGRTTIALVNKLREMHPTGFKLINERSRKVEKEYSAKKYNLSGGSKLVFKKKIYSGFKRKDVKR